MLDFPPLKGKRMKIGWDLAVGAAILIGALGLRAVDPLPLQQLRNLTFDTYQRLKPRQYDPNVPVVIDAAAVARYEDAVARIGLAAVQSSR